MAARKAAANPERTKVSAYDKVEGEVKKSRDSNAKAIGVLTGERMKQQIEEEKHVTMTAYMDDESTVILTDVKMDDVARDLGGSSGLLSSDSCIVVTNQGNTECVVLAWKHVVSIEVRAT